MSGGLVYFARKGVNPEYLHNRVQAYDEDRKPIDVNIDKWGRLNEQVYTHEPHDFIVVKNNLIIEYSNDCISK